MQAVADGPWGQDGKLHTDRCFQLNPVTWQQLRDNAATVLGRRPRPAVTAAEVAAFCRDNLGEYWQPLLDRADAVVGALPDGAAPGNDIVVWIALGPPRLWHTIGTGEIVSKTRAGELAAERWPDLAEPIAAVIAAHRRDRAELTTREARAAVLLGRRVLAAATGV